MATYIASTFISSYLSTSRTLRIVNASGIIVFSLSVCNYQKSLVSGSNLSIVLEDNNKEYLLDFSSNAEAKAALTLFKTAVDTLRPNCTPPPQGGGPTAAPVPISITYTNYKIAQQAATLLPLQWYDVVDTNGIILSPGTTIRMLAVTATDAHPSGTVLDTTNANIGIDVYYDSVSFYELPKQRATFINSQPSQQTLDSNSSDIFVTNESSIITHTCNFIKISNSTATLTSCTQINIDNCNIVLNNATNVSLDNIQQNLSTIGFNLSNVQIDRNESIGMGGRTAFNPLANGGNNTLKAYLNNVEQSMTLNTSSNSPNITLDNKIVQANAEFRLRYIGTGSNNNISVFDINDVNIFTITDAHKGSWVIFRYNKTTTAFEFINLTLGDSSAGTGISIGGTSYYVTPVSNGQTSFPLPTPATQPSSLEMFINGQKKVFGLDFTYSSGGQTVTYLNRNFSISSTDEIDFIIF